MKNELILYKPNVLDNWNFLDSSNKRFDPSDGITPEEIWLGTGGDNDSWILSNGQAIVSGTHSTNDIMYQENVFTNGLDYKIVIQVSSISGQLNILAGTNSFGITQSGNYSYIFNTGTYSNISLEAQTGDVTVDWIKAFQYPDVYQIDLTDEITVPLTYAIADIKDISKRNSTFSKTVTLPATPKNNKFFSQIFEISGDSQYNANKKIDSVILSDGMEIFNGVLKMNNINRNENGYNNYDLISYDVNLTGSVANIFNELADIKLNELNISEYDHSYTRPNQIASWTQSVQRNGATYSNFTNGSSKTITSIQSNNNDGSGFRVQINMSTAHGFAIGDQIYLDHNTVGNPAYRGDHIVYDIVNSNSVVINYPFDTSFNPNNVWNGIAYKHSPTGEGYVYPMINTGKSTTTSWAVTDFFPAVYAKTYVDKIFQKAGFKYQSDFLDSEYFKRLIIPYSKKELTLSNSNKSARLFHASTTGTQSFNWTMFPRYSNDINNNYTAHWTATASVTPSTYIIPFDKDSPLPDFDNNSVYNTTLYTFNCPVTGSYDMSFDCYIKSSIDPIPNVLYTGDFYADDFVINHGFIIENANTINNTNQIVLGGATTKTDFVQTSTFSTYTNITHTFSNLNLVAGQKYRLRINPAFKTSMQAYVASTYFIPSFGNYPAEYTGTLNQHWEFAAGAVLFNSANVSTQDEGSILEMNSCIPDKISCKDFLKSLISMFNLYVEPSKDDSKLLLIEPRNDFYASGTTIDWTSKLDVSQQIQITPLGELTNKTYTYAYKEDKDYFNADHKDKYVKVYGNYQKVIDNDFVSGELKNEIIFSPTVLADYPVGSKRIISQMMKSNSETMDTNIRILYYSMRSGSPDTWSYTSNSLSTLTQTLYPYAGHLDNPICPYNDLNFWYPVSLYYDSDSYSNRNLFNVYHRNQIDEITNKNAKVVTANLYLKAYDIFKLNFRNIYIIDGHHLRLNKISDYFVGQISPVKCEFTKVEFTNPFVRPRKIPLGIKGKTFQIDGLDVPRFNRFDGTNKGSNHQSSVFVTGYGNVVNPFMSTNVEISGNDNTVSSPANNILIKNSNNIFVYGGLNNITVINSSNLTITESNTTIINGIMITGSGVMINLNINLIDAGGNVVLDSFNSASQYNLIDGGTDNVLDCGNNNAPNNIELS